MAELGDESKSGGEQGAASHRPSFAPTAPPRRPSVASTAPAPNSLRRQEHDSEAPSSKFDGEDFLFHLYRGSELLQDNCVSEAKEELELALRVQPQDIEGQGLLGVVYFRLGLYPRAQEIYQDIIRVRPEEISPRVNLALCYLKTGQSQSARDCLEEVTARVPEHVRAWGYLGLVHERLGDFEKARSAFERAGQPHLVRRMQQLIDQAIQGPESAPAERAEIRAAAAEAVQELETDEPGFSRASTEAEIGPVSRAGRWRAIEPGEDVSVAPRARRSSLPGRFGPAVPAIPEPTELARASLLPAPIQGAVPSIRAQVDGPDPVVAPSRRSALIEVTTTWAVRGDAVRGLLAHGPAFTNTPLLRRMRGKDLNEPLGGPGSPWVLLAGAGQVLVGAPPSGSSRRSSSAALSFTCAKAAC